MKKDKIVEEFPSKEECIGSLLRKRNAIRVEYHKCARLQHINYLYGVSPGYKNDRWEGEPGEKPIFFKRFWRGQRSRYLKKLCTRHVRRLYKKMINTEKFDIAVCRAKSIKHKETEFWWELD